MAGLGMLEKIFNSKFVKMAEFDFLGFDHKDALLRRDDLERYLEEVLSHGVRSDGLVWLEAVDDQDVINVYYDERTMDTVKILRALDDLGIRAKERLDE